MSDPAEPSAEPAPRRPLWRRFLPIGVLASAVALAFAFGLDDYLNYQALCENSDQLIAWVDAYGLITNVMLDGADYSESDVQLSAPAEEAPVLVDGPNPTTFIGSIAGVLGIVTLLLILL